MLRSTVLRISVGVCALGSCIAASCLVEVPQSRPAGSGGGDTGSAGGPVCSAGTADCNDDGVCETDLVNDPNNCGACGHDCLGTSCAQRACQAVAIRTNLTYPHLVAVDDDYVYWTEGGAGFGAGVVGRCSKTGSDPTELVSQANKPRGIALTDDFVYWTDGKNGKLHRVPKAGGNDEVLVDPQWENTASGAIGDSGAVIAGQRIYWTHPLAGEVYGADLDGGGVVTLVDEPPGGDFEPQHVAVLDGFLYIANRAAPEVRRVPIEGGTVEIIASVSDPSVNYSAGIAVAGGAVFVRETRWGPGEYGRVARLQPQGLAWTVLASTPGAVALASDGNTIFWSGADGTLSRAGLDGSDTRVLAAGQANPTGIAEDEDAVYWANRAIGAPKTGAIMRVAK